MVCLFLPYARQSGQPSIPHLLTNRALDSQNDSTFIPASEKPWFIWLFGWIVTWLFHRHFSKVHVDLNYTPTQGTQTLYYLNHTSWWDGLIPLYLKQRYLHQPSRAMMEDRQMRQYRFFRWIGAFSVHLHDPRAAIPSLRYAVESLKRPGSCLFIYPEGAISPPSDSLPTFKNGIGWIVHNTRRERLALDVVPVSVFIHTMRRSKPECHIRVGTPVDPGLLNPEAVHGEGTGKTTADREGDATGAATKAEDVARKKSLVGTSDAQRITLDLHARLEQDVRTLIRDASVE